MALASVSGESKAAWIDTWPIFSEPSPALRPAEPSVN